MWFYPRAANTDAHNGTSPAAPMITPFNFPCGQNFLNVYFQGGVEMRDKCVPPNFEQYWWSSVGYYSPALCPKGYTAGCMRWNSEQGPAAEPTETAVQCVPSGYVCDTKHISMAYSRSHTAPMIQVRWAENDLSRFPTHPLYPGAKPTNHVQKDGSVELVARASFDGSFRPGPTPTSGGGSGSGGSSGSDDGGGLSTGAKIGIGVAVPVVVLALFSIGAFFVWRAYRKKRLGNTGGQQPHMQYGQYPQQYPPGPQYPQPVVYANPGLQPMMEPGRYEMPAHGTTSPTVFGSEAVGPSLPAPAVLAKARDGTAEMASQSHSPVPAGSELDVHTYRTDISTANASELHGTSQSPPIEVGSESRQETDASQQQMPTSPIQRKQVASPGHQVSPMSPSTAGPDTMVAIMPGTDNSGVSTSAEAGTFPFQTSPEPSADEIAALQAQHAHLEARKQRLLELEQIEAEQADLQRRMDSARGNSPS